MSLNFTDQLKQTSTYFTCTGHCLKLYSVSSKVSAGSCVLCVLSLLILMLPSMVVAAPNTQTQSEQAAPVFDLDFSGSQSWILQYGLGDSRGLSKKGYSRNLTIQMPLEVAVKGAVPIDWPVVGKLSISAELDNQKSDNLQTLAINFDSQNFSGMFGKFTVGEKTSFAVYNKKMMGIKAEAKLDQDLTLTGMVSRVEGISATKTFRGNTASDEVTYSLFEEDRPWEEKPYLTTIRGLEFYQLKEAYVEGFTEVKLRFELDGLNKFLTSYELGYLSGIINQENEKELTESTYEVIPTGNNQYLVLKREVKSLRRSAIQDYISQYNIENELEEEDKKEYPFNRGTDYEKKFLNSLADYVPLAVGNDIYPIAEYERERFYYLGHKDVEQYSLSVEIKTNGEFESIEEPEFEGYDYQLFPEVGIVEFIFPASFFDKLETNQIQVTYDYQITQNVYMLGLSIVKGSEKVFLNGERLSKGQDYSIDYETGTLIMFIEVESDDVVKVDYEVARGGLGGYAEYKRNFAGSTLSYQPFEGLNCDLQLLKAWDQPAPSEEISRLHTMPNDHFILGLEGKLDWEWLKGDLQLAYNHNLFPFDDKERENQVNQINAILPIERDNTTYVIFGHQNGITVFDGTNWSSFSTGDGLAGRSVYEMAKSADSSTIVFATESGVSTLDWKKGETLIQSLSKVERWARFYEDDGLPDDAVYASYIEEDVLWLGTEEGLAKVPIAKIDNPSNWIVYQKNLYPGLIDNWITKLAGLGESLFVGTKSGLMIYDYSKDSFQVVSPLKGIKINDLKSSISSIYAATSKGIFELNTMGLGNWIIEGLEVNSLSTSENYLLYGTPNGAHIWGENDPLIEGWSITTLANDGKFWIGPRGIESDSDYYLSIWSMSKELDQLARYTKKSTNIRGKDLYRFKDLPARGHIDRGVLASLTLRQQLGQLVLKETLESVSPEFTAIGKSQREDYLRWVISGDYSFAPKITLSGRHSNKTTNLSADSSGPKTLIVADSLDFSWKSGPMIKGEATIKRKDNQKEEGFDQLILDLSGSITEDLFADLIHVSLSYKDNFLKELHQQASWSRESKVQAQLTIKPHDNLAISANYVAPLLIRRRGKLEDKIGQKNLDLSFDWRRNFSHFKVATKYDHNLKWEVGEIHNLRNNDEAEISFNFDPFEIADLQIRPQAKLNGQGKSGKGAFGFNWDDLKLTGQINCPIQLTNLNVGLHLKRDFQYYRLSKRVEIADQGQATINWTSYQKFSPQLTLKITKDLLTHPWYGKRESSQILARFSLGWDPSRVIQNDFSISWEVANSNRKSTDTYSFTNTLNWTISDLFSSQTSLEGSYLAGTVSSETKRELEMELTQTLQSELAKNWDGSFTGGYLFGIANHPSDNYQSLIAELVITTTF